MAIPRTLVAEPGPTHAAEGLVTEESLLLALPLHPFTALLGELVYFGLWVRFQASFRGEDWLCPKAYRAREKG